MKFYDWLIKNKAKKDYISEADFLMQFIDSIRNRCENVNIQNVKENMVILNFEELEFKVDVSNSYIETGSKKSEVDNIIDKLVHSILETKDSTGEIILDSIYPVIRNKSLGEELFQEEYIESLSIFFVLDDLHSIRYLTYDQISSLKISLEDLRMRSLENLERKFQNVDIIEDEGKYMIVNGQDYESSFVLLKKTWNRKKISVNGEYVFTIPNRDLLLIAGSFDEDNLKRIKIITEKSFEEGSYPVSPNIFKISQEMEVSKYDL